MTSTTANNYAVSYLTSNTTAGTVDNLAANTVASGDSNTFTFPTAAYTDPKLSGAWGVAFGPAGYVWVNDQATNYSTLYQANGMINAGLPSVAIPNNAAGAAAGPSGIVANINTINCPTVSASTCTAGTGFLVGGSPAKFIFAGTGGTISAWYSGSMATTEYDGSAAGDSFTGLGIYTQSSGSTWLLATNFAHGVVDVFDTNFKLNTTAFPGGFHDPNLPAGYAPFGVQTIGNMIYVSYAKQPATPGPEVDGEGYGMVDVFDGTGTLVKELILPGGALNAPWGMAMAPMGFGQYGGDLLVGNFGDGRINVFNPMTGAYIAALTNSSTNMPVHIPGLWGIAFGNNQNGQSPTTLYFAATPDMHTQGLYGSISAAAMSSSSSMSSSASSSSSSYGGY